MYEMEVGNAQYILPLQSFDLTHLSRYVLNPREEKKPLWSNKYLDGESQYYTVEIVAQDINQHDCYDELSATYKCHICNVQVPKIYIKEHNDSKKHEVYKKICENLLERVTKLINVNMHNGDNEMTTDIYYCMQCSKVIKLKNKYKHEASDYHIKSLENLQALNDFYEMCIENKDNVSQQKLFQKQNHESESCEDINEDIAYNNVGCSENTRNDLMLKKRIPTFNSDDDFSISDGISFFDETEDENIDLLSITKQNDWKAASNSKSTGADAEKTSNNNELSANKHKDKKLKNSIDPGLKNDTKTLFNVVRAPSESEVSSSLDRTTNAPVYNTSFQNGSIASSESSIVASESKKGINDSASNLKMDGSDANNKQVTHPDTKSNLKCTVCNVIISYSDENIIEHVEGSNHKSMISNNLDKQKTDAYYIQVTYTDDRKSVIKCTTCNVYISCSDRNIIGHIEGRNHKDMVNILEKQKIEGYYKQLEYTDDTKRNIKCPVCNVHISYSDKYVIEHMEGRNHKDMIDKLTKLTKQKIDGYYKQVTFTDDTKTSVKCTVCKVIIPHSDKNVIEHMEGRNHKVMIKNLEKQKMDSYYKQLEYTDDKKTKIKCTICNVNISYSNKNIIEHMEGRNHKDMIDTIYKQKIDGYYKQVTFTDDTKTRVKCAVCDVVIPHSDKNVIEHMEGRNHKDMIDKINKEKIDGYYKQLKYTDDTKTNVKCAVCDVVIPHSDKNVIEHMEGRNHKDMIDKINKEKIDGYYKQLKYTDDTKTNVKCTVCNVIVSYSDKAIIEHMEGRNHNDIIKNRNQQKIDGYYKQLVYTNDTKTVVRCTVCNVNIAFAERNITKHMEGKNHAKNVRTIAYSGILRFTDNTKKEVTCVVCDTDFTYAEEIFINHINHKDHVENQNKLLKLHSIKYCVLDGYFCDSCDTSVTKFFEHINSEAHTNKYQMMHVIDDQKLRHYVYAVSVRNNESIAYRELYKNLLKSNKITTISTASFYCEICSLDLCRHSEIGHVLGERHMDQKQ